MSLENFFIGKEIIFRKTKCVSHTQLVKHNLRLFREETFLLMLLLFCIFMLDMQRTKFNK